MERDDSKAVRRAGEAVNQVVMSGASAKASPSDMRPIARVRRACAALVGFADPDVAWLTDLIERYQAEAGSLTLDDALGLSRRGGAGPWWVVEARERRDAAVRELHASFFASLDRPAAAKVILQLSRRRRESRAPASGGRDALMDAVLRSSGRFPTTEKGIQAILGNPVAD